MKSMNIKNIGLIANINSKNTINITKKIIEKLEGKNIEIIVEEKLAEKIQWKKNKEKIEKMNVSIIMIIGGDGTVLRATRLIEKSETPILTVNTGTIGFLSEINPKEVIEAIETIQKNKFKLEKCTRIKAKVNNEEIADALNEITIITRKPVKVLNLEVIKNDEETIFSGRADGIIIATKTGSTAYALSAGGPIIDPELDVITIVPLCPLKIYQKPVIVPATSKITVKIKRKGSSALVVADGQIYREAPLESKITIKKSNRKTVFIRLKKNFYEKLRERLTKNV